MTTPRTILLAMASLVLLVAACTQAPGATFSTSSTSPTAMPATPAATPTATPASPAANSGIRGTATAGPVCPVEKNPPDPACAPRPVPGAVLVVRDPSGSEVARVTTGADGTFSVAVGPGAYTVVPQPVEGMMGTAAPVDVTVATGSVATIEIGYDTGIR